MTVKKRSDYKTPSQMPLSELPIMRALLAILTPPAGGETTHNRAIDVDSKTQVTMLRLRIVDKIQVLALRRPQALIVAAQVLDKLLDQELEFLMDRTLADEATARE